MLKLTNNNLGLIALLTIITVGLTGCCWKKKQKAETAIAQEAAQEETRMLQQDSVELELMELEVTPGETDK